MEITHHNPMITIKMKDEINQVPQPLPPIAQLATNMTEGIIQDIMRTELTEEVTKLLKNHNMTGENGFLRVAVARNIVNAYLSLPQNTIKQDTEPENDPIETDKPLFAVAKNQDMTKQQYNESIKTLISEPENDK